MHLTVREAANFLDTSEEKIHDWIETEHLPAHKINDQYRINRSELLEWATAHKLAVAPELFQQAENSDAIPTVSESLRRGGIFYAIHGESRESLLRNLADRLKFEDESERETLLQLLLARESLGSTGIGHGIAIPHVRNPIVLAGGEPLLTLCFIEPSAELTGPDGKPLFALFLLLCPTIHVHLQMLARLSYLLRLPEFREKILACAPADEILNTAALLEKRS